jgi:uncharacterized membrane protein YebE (DUF533 family)
MPDTAEQAQTAEKPQAGAPPEHDESLVHVLAAKIFVDWLRNRQQLLVPFNLDLQNLGQIEAGSVIEAMAAAAQADGTLDAKTHDRLNAAMERIHANDGHRAALGRALERRRALGDILRDVKDVQAGAVFYAASLLAIDRRKRVNRHYLRYLAERLQLSRDFARSLERRFGAAS